MFIFKNSSSLHRYLNQVREKGHVIGLVPTMGALHSGHLSLIQNSLDDGNVSVCSIFVNPTQFNQSSDFDLYPRIPEADLEKLEATGCHAVFMPNTAEMYPEGEQKARYDFGPVTQALEGAHRPGHFDGVITIVNKLFQLINPNHAYFGQKDYQQCLVISEMVNRFGLDIRLHFVPTLREMDGLAMSSRNTRLSAEERKDASVIFQTLEFLKTNYGSKPVDELIREAEQRLNQKLKSEYVAIFDSRTFLPVTEVHTQQPIALVAAWCGNVRLIDNMFL